MGRWVRTSLSAGEADRLTLSWESFSVCGRTFARVSLGCSSGVEVPGCRAVCLPNRRVPNTGHASGDSPEGRAGLGVDLSSRRRGLTGLTGLWLEARLGPSLEESTHGPPRFPQTRGWPSPTRKCVAARGRCSCAESPSDPPCPRLHGCRPIHPAPSTASPDRGSHPPSLRLQKRAGLCFASATLFAR